ncbi:WD40 repeat-like protein [Athelia psychrophila]|uniref:WD40 repeat-like protein n=1 Tax=Athelia psychrophila TaxID=1759441 RepID=A0A167TR64_9AGAM|nr:WD40 repeat-like protein [Fibularhizoctonia sp. CBS 109695]
MALPLLPSHSMLYQLFHDSLVDPSVLLVTYPDYVRCLALSTNGRRIVIGSGLRAIVRDTATGEELVKLGDRDGTALPFSVAFSYDGSRIACGTDESTVYVWDSVTGARVIGPLSHSGSSKYVNVVAWSTDGKCLLSGCHTGEVILWNITSPNGNQPITKIHHPGCIAWKNPLSSLVFSSDGSQIASCSRRGDVHVWDSKTSGMVWSVQEPHSSDPSGGISFLSSGTREFLVVKTKEYTQARDASTGELCLLPDSLAGAVGLTRDDFTVNLLMKGIKKHYPGDGENMLFPEWVVQGEYFAFTKGSTQCHAVHLPKSVQPDVILQSAMTTHGLPAKLTTTDRCTSRSSTARFFSRGLSNGAEESNVAEVASKALMRHPSARVMHESREAMPRVLRNDCDEYKGSITGDNDEQDFPMNQAVLPYRHPPAPGVATMLQFQIPSFVIFNNIVPFAFYAVVLYILLCAIFKPFFSSQGHPRSVSKTIEETRRAYWTKQGRL